MPALNRIITSTLVACACLASSIQTAPASANPNVDQNLKSALDRAGLNYSIVENKYFKLTFNFNSGRKHTAFIESATSDFNKSTKVRRIFSVIPEFENDVSQETKKQLLQNSNQKRIGSWIAISPRAYSFIAKVDANLSPEDLKRMTDWVAAVGDEMEQKLFERDRLQ
jgi:hypothetical protein